VITECFQGELEVVTVRTGEVARHKFFMLALDLPPIPVFPDDGEKNILPQVPFLELLLKYDGEREAESIKHGPRRFRLTRLPPFLIFHYQRFVRNNFFLEKNPTIVTFPVKNLELRGHVPVPEGTESKYDLAASVVHDGEAGGGKYKVQVRGAEPGAWWEVQDLVVSETLPQMVTLAEAYLQIFERQ
jgi:U4/U6.U5 tri-snRNP-associated protein 2